MFVVSEMKLTYDEPRATWDALLLTPVLREISCIHSNDVVADHGNHGEKAKQVGKIVKSLMRNHRRYVLNTKQRKD